VHVFQELLVRAIWLGVLDHMQGAAELELRAFDLLTREPANLRASSSVIFSISPKISAIESVLFVPVPRQRQAVSRPKRFRRICVFQ
jgi:hypothetical protein